MCEECEAEEFASPAELSWWDPVIIGLRLVGDLAQSVAAAFNGGADTLTGHTYFLTERKSFLRDAGMEIERLTEES